MRIIRVVATPGARKERITKVEEGLYHIAVNERSERSAANRRICALVAELYHVLPTQVRILTGHRSRSKMIGVDVSL